MILFASCHSLPPDDAERIGYLADRIVEHADDAVARIRENKDD